MNLDYALAGYIDCALITEGTPSYHHQGLTRSNITPETVVSMRADVARFARETQGIVGEAEVEPYDFGYDFWSTRNCQENSFWEQRNLPTQQVELLTKHAHAFGGYSLGCNDQGELYGGPS